MTFDDISIGARDLVAGLGAVGRSIAIVSPGSRNTPLALAFAASPVFEDVAIRDERSAGFMALGFAKATGVPAVVVCTSGSAGSHYLPAVVEADQTATPMVVVTADRPVHLRGTFAPQTMDQTNLFGNHAKRFVDVDITGDTRSIGEHAVTEARSGVPGVVHLNVPLDEPLTPPFLTPAAAPSERTGSADPSTPTLGVDLEGRKVVVVVGGFWGREVPSMLASWAEAAGVAVLADPQCRTDHPAFVNGDLLAGAGYFDHRHPETIIRLGHLAPSRALSEWLASTSASQILVNASRLSDPLGTVARTIDTHPHTFLAIPPGFQAETTYRAELVAADALAHSAALTAIDGTFPSEPLVAAELIAGAPDGSVVFVGSSMPIRDVETFTRGRTGVDVIANRGVNGIDGAVSTAVGIASSGVPTIVLCGDITALHDATALAEVQRLDLPVRVVVVNNDGGGIFSFLPQRRTDVIPSDLYERHWGTPHGLSLVDVAAGYGMAARTVTDHGEFRDAIRRPVRPELLEVRTDRTDNVTLHDNVRTAVRAALTEM
ncbi:MAG: 2-succinyl-5-enolpyruvyl-6-hydroxy-3-cyclohexene-1-carboxylic-acid synthase [Acidimicrobiia bacterium]|nr:2-succinyl-5-enolpyruvyl-6-hydroxy-3-cyclohexene-1-carboxylic-acid synthase [Acidimicrobiia bacterium]